MHHRKPDHTGRWQIIAYLAVSVAVLTNAVWFYNWRTQAVEHHNELTTARAEAAGPEIVFEYIEPPQTREATQQSTAAEERCMYGQVLRKIPDGWAGTGRSC